jgi:protein-L-isoaspartate O-methyltransferase
VAALPRREAHADTIGTVRRCLAVLWFTTLLSCRGVPADQTRGVSADASAAPTVDEASVKAMSHALLDAYDRADEDGVAGALGPAFVLFDELRLEPRDSVLTRLHKRLVRRAPPRTRTYREEHTSITGNSAVFIAETVEHYPRDGALPCEDGSCITGDFDGWSTLVWVRDGNAWKVASWQWVKGGIEAERDEWDAVYREGTAFNPAPNNFLVEMVKGRKPGLALDVAMGQGRNALYLASRGWRVTGIDISDEGLRQARKAAAARKLAIEAINADADTWDYGVEKWDLIVLSYAGCDENVVKRSLKPGGLVVAEVAHKDLNPRIGAETDAFSVAYKDGFKILRNEVVEDVSDWGWKERTRGKLVRFAAEKQ